MWLPILNKHDGHRLTCGARVSFADPVGRGSRVSIPMTWGGERRVAAELEHIFGRGPFSSLRGSASIHRQVNPHFRMPDTRRQVIVHAERSLARWLRTGADARLAQVAFGPESQHPASPAAAADWHRSVGAHVTLDTRVDPSFPRNAFHATLGWERLAFRHAGA